MWNISIFQTPKATITANKSDIGKAFFAPQLKPTIRTMVNKIGEKANNASIKNNLGLITNCVIDCKLNSM